MILDTTLLIAAERGRFDMATFLADQADAPVAIASITASELLHGVERARDSAARARRGQYVEGVLGNLPVIPFGMAEARLHARIWAELATKGKMIGAHDLLVAATALGAGSTVATLNQRDFKRVGGLGLAPIQRFLRA